MTSKESGLKDGDLTVLYDFAKAISAVFDIQTLMTHFFNILRTAVDYDAGAYFVCHENHFEGRLYAAGSLEKEKADDFSAGFIKSVSAGCGSQKERVKPLEVSVLMGGRKDRAGRMRTLDIKLKYQGGDAGLIRLGSWGEGPFERTPLIDAMAAHASGVIERLVTHMFAEEKKLADILLNMSDGVYIIDRNGRFTAVNKKGLDMVSAFCGRGISCIEESCAEDLVPGACCEFARCVKRLTGSRTLAQKARREEIKNEQGRVYALTASALSPDGGCIVTARDITEEQMMQKRIMLSSKLASLGEMAAGVAHEINNPLQAILCNIELLEYDTNETGHRKLKRVREGVLRIKTIIKDLLIFAREQTTETENADLNTVIEKSIDILKHQLRMVNVKTRLDLFRDPVIVKINRNMFQQVIINLIQNSRDAIEDSGVGSAIEIRTRLEAGDSAVVEVRDDGPGIPEQILDRVFDPFFTTKDVGKGTGLGLSVSRKIVEGMDGTITVDSAPGKGTVFRITIPHRGAAVDERRGKKRLECDYSALGEKSVLIVDDDEDVLRIVSEALRARVKSVEPVSSADEAIERITGRDFDFDFIFLDIKMPGTDGMELFKRVAAVRPHLAGRVVFITGDIESRKTSEFLKRTGCRYLAKPFAMSEVLDVMYDGLFRDKSAQS